MYSLQGDTVLDPFLGTGTTTIAAIASQRNSVGYEIDPKFLEIITNNIENTSINYLNSYTQNRIDNHKEFVLKRSADVSKKPIKHYNENLKMPVMTSQETNIELSFVNKIERENNVITAAYNTIKPLGIELPKSKKKVRQTSLFEF